MRFQSKQRPRGLLRPSDKRRMMLMVVGVAVILICFTVARRPQFWANLFPDDPATADASPEAATPSVAGAGSEPLRSDEFLVGSDQQAVTEVRAFRIPLEDSDTSEDLLPRLPDELLRSIKDNVIGIHSTESDAYYAAMKLASKLSRQQLATAKKGAFALFMDSPDGSRGVVWKMRGELRQLSVTRGRPNIYGLGGRLLYDAWITTPDSGDQLVHVVTTDADNSLGKHIEAAGKERTVRFMGKDAPKVHFTGFFFKREAYATVGPGSLSIAPLFVAGTLHEMRDPVVTRTRADDITPWLGWLTVVVTCGVVLISWSFSLSDAASANSRVRQLTRLPAHASFEDVTAVTVTETLEELQTRPSTAAADSAASATDA